MPLSLAFHSKLRSEGELSWQLHRKVPDPQLSLQKAISAHSRESIQLPPTTFLTGKCRTTQYPWYSKRYPTSESTVYSLLTVTKQL